MNEKNYYEVLGVASHVGAGQIQAAYRFARSLYTGETTPSYGLLDSHERTRMLAVVEEAYDVLSNPNLRREYDLKLSEGTGQAPAPATPAPAPTSPGRAPRPSPRPVVATSGAMPPPPRVPDVVNGQALKALRESCGLTIDQIAALSKVGTRFLQALEDDRHEALPGRVFARGFLTEYARALRVPDSEVVERYLRHWTGKQ
jgi:flagellar biosynthesis protein FlhG